jgi:hypothetical protein
MLSRVDGLRLRNHGIQNKVSFDSNKARVFANIADASEGKIDDVDRNAHASHLCGNPYCRIPGHVVIEEPGTNYQRDACRARAVGWRKQGKKLVPWACGIHGEGVPDCLLQLMVLTDVERTNIQLSFNLVDHRIR